MGAWITPLVAALITGAVMTVVPFARQGGISALPRRGWVAVALLFAALVWAGAELGFYAPVRVGDVVWGRPAGVVLAASAGALALVGSRARRRADLWLSEAPVEIDDAVEAARRGEVPRARIFRGRLGAAEQVTSPGGIVCAFYAASIRSIEADGTRGTLLSSERGQASPLYLVGARVSCTISANVRELWAPIHVRRCQLAGNLSLGVSPALATGEPPSQALSYERVGKIGEGCLASGRLERGPEGGWSIVGTPGSPASLVVGDDSQRFGRRHQKTARLALALATVCTISSAYLFSAAG